MAASGYRENYGVAGSLRRDGLGPVKVNDSLTTKPSLHVGDRVLVRESEEATIIATAQVYQEGLGPDSRLVPFVKVQYDGWFAKQEWHPDYRVSLIVVTED